MITRKDLVRRFKVSNPTIRRALRHLQLEPCSIVRDAHNVPTYFYDESILPKLAAHLQYSAKLRQAKCPKGYAKCRGGCKKLFCLAALSGSHICKQCRNQKLLKNIAYDFKPWLKVLDVPYIHKAIQYLQALLPKQQ